MLVRPDRLLPSVIVGALLIGALALGAGTASADPIDIGDLLPTQCIDPDTQQPKTLVTGLARNALTGVCEVAAGVRDAAVDPPSTTVVEPDPAPPSTATTTATTASLPSSVTSQPVAPAPAAPISVARPPVAVVPPAALVAPAAAAPGGLAATVPLLNFGTPNPALLLAPPGSPLRTLAGENTGSPVTTTSDVQAIAFDNMPGGMGTPAVVGVLILSTLGAFALRHRMLRRARTPVSSER
ncbi:hypothetical protein ACFPK1_07995 [Actinomycetospora rhizophila]|uniref:Uncharacterized protein n=1 Tax=Actinomycetospora rhizophila TaxID=1416876 RepID=A0ABV9Z9X3_9PSEU